MWEKLVLACSSGMSLPLPPPLRFWFKFRTDKNPSGTQRPEFAVFHLEGFTGTLNFKPGAFHLQYHPLLSPVGLLKCHIVNHSNDLFWMDTYSRFS